ncbi:MAG: hypothetical protein R3B91_00725 [Planctomycetaceae bacterium]
MADVSSSGLVHVKDVPGNVAVMVRYQGKVAVFTAAVPLGATVNNLPEARTSLMSMSSPTFRRSASPVTRL